MKMNGNSGSLRENSSSTSPFHAIRLKKSMSSTGCLRTPKQLWAWLEEGAYFYVCGDAHRMAKDVEAMLQRIVQEQGQMSEEAAKIYVKTLRTQKRYLADVY